MKKKKHVSVDKYPISWLPIDSRLFTPIFKFDTVTGIAKIFLQIEITLAILIVVGTLFVALLKILSVFIK